MNLKSIIREYWDVFRANVDDGNSSSERNNGLQTALFVVSAFSIIMAAINFLAGDYQMMLSSIWLGLLFAGTYIVRKKAENRVLSTGICIIGLIIVFTYYILSGGSDGFSILWTMLAPMFVMACIGVKAGTAVSLYLQILLIVFFWTPLRFVVEDHYTATFMRRFPILFLCTMIVSLAVMLSHKKQQISINKHQSELERTVRSERNKATQIIFQTIGAIISIVDAKDPYTDDHSLRVAQYSLALAHELGWEHEKAERLYYCALLHDIGKTGIPDYILKKSSRLTDAEYNIMQTHTSIGATILKEMNFLEDVDKGALYHHEKYDGTGYPFGLKGEEIPLEARIICLADSFDAMNTARVYRKRCDQDFILSEIRKGRGTQFDPDVVDAFFRCLDHELISFSGL